MLERNNLKNTSFCDSPHFYFFSSSQGETPAEPAQVMAFHLIPARQEPRTGMTKTM